MKKTLPFLFVIICCVFGAELEYESEPSRDDIACLNGESCKNGGAGAGGGGGGSGGASAANIAQKAAQEAKAAEDAQQQAGQQAAHQVKEQLAEKAIEAAKAADAALAGKEELVAQIQQEIKEAEVVIGEEGTNLQKLIQTVDASNKAGQEAKAEVKLLQTALQLAVDNASNAQISLDGAQKELTEKEQIIEAAKSRYDSLNKQVAEAKAVLQATREATRKAEAAAAEAKQNAMRNRRRRSKI